jgi:uncharacterized membrane protein
MHLFLNILVDGTCSEKSCILYQLYIVLFVTVANHETKLEKFRNIMKTFFYFILSFAAICHESYWLRGKLMDVLR